MIHRSKAKWAVAGTALVLGLLSAIPASAGDHDDWKKADKYRKAQYKRAKAYAKLDQKHDKWHRKHDQGSRYDREHARLHDRLDRQYAKSHKKHGSHNTYTEYSGHGRPDFRDRPNQPHDNGLHKGWYKHDNHR